MKINNEDAPGLLIDPALARAILGDHAPRGSPRLARNLAAGRSAMALWLLALLLGAGYAAWYAADRSARGAAVVETVTLDKQRTDGDRMIVWGPQGEFVVESAPACAQIASMWVGDRLLQVAVQDIAVRNLNKSLTISVEWYERPWPFQARVILRMKKSGE